MSEHNFRTKALAIANQLLPDIQNKEDSVVQISGEKKSTIKNWLYANKRPPMGKRLMIADKFGVDVDYLFSDSPYSIPITQFDESLKCYLVPRLALSQLTCLEQTEPMPVAERTIISLSPELLEHLESYQKTYCLVASGIHYEPFITAADTLFFNSTAKHFKSNFCILVSDETQIVRMQQDGAIVSKDGDIIQPRKSDTLLPIIITMSSSYVTYAQ
ncbi:hypothetical protein JQC92_20865 [Shewanella sp. 202IG2-18]|uniref:hypothetical protein n=1 Tax=Parashewanella hymeniacidonis TaxID=2807618 RepID=UPI001960C15C|nr:hypothetical protein [Parashewanella hymeniacidonis]MBM7074443.1 hypothetical protein [Parashewanella hymeniacidonis]